MGDYHSVTCWSDECDGWHCDCWCHDDGPVWAPDDEKED